MKSNKSLLYCTAAGIGAGALAAVMLFLGGKNEFESDIGYFVKGSVFAAVLYIALAVGCALGVLSWVLHRKQTLNNRVLPGTFMMPALSVLCGAAVIALTVSNILYYDSAAPDKFAVIRYISYLLSVPAAAALVMSAFSRGKAPSALSCLLGFFTPLFFASKVLVDYFDHSTAVNSPVKIICQITYIAFMLLFTAEEGISLGRGRIYPRYLLTLFASVAFGFSAGLGGLILYFSGVSFPISLEDSVLFLCTSLYASGRLFGAIFCPVSSAEQTQASDIAEETEEKGTEQ